MINHYLKIYLADIVNSLLPTDLDALYGAVHAAALSAYPILVFGNGGSAAIAEHLSCDFMKGVAHDVPLNYPHVHSLVSNQSLMTAIANDYGYNQVFSKQIEYTSYSNALAIAISSSGNSENIVRGLKMASLKGYTCAALVGFDGGRVVSECLAAGLTVHVKSCNYGVVEDSHQIIMHAIAQQLRLQQSNDPSNIRL
jgi:D-sedoheptulose 7-phosphate isomerase